MVVLSVTWAANPGKEAAVADVFSQLEEESRREPGCLMYVVHRHRTDPRVFFIYEQYSNDAALEAHRQSSHFQRYAITALKDIAERTQGELYVPLNDDARLDRRRQK